MGHRFTLVAAILLMLAGIIVLVVGDGFALGVTLLVLGAVALALTAGKGRSKGGEIDH